MRSISIAALAVSACILTSSIARANLLVNGDFETPVVPDASFMNFNTAADMGGWTVVGPQVSIVKGDFTQNGFNFVAQSGTQWVDLTGDGANSTLNGIEQSVATTPGTEYTLSFWVGNVVDQGGIFGTISNIDILIDGSSFNNAENLGGTGSANQNWEKFSFNFSADFSTTQIQFRNADPSSDNSNGLDNVSLVQTNGGPGPSGVPLPAAAWPTLAALTLLAGLQLFRTRLARI